MGACSHMDTRGRVTLTLGQGIEGAKRESVARGCCIDLQGNWCEG